MMNLGETLNEVDMMHWGKQVSYTGIVLLSTLTVIGCATTTPTPQPDMVVEEVISIPDFIPENFVARIRNDGGKYQTLFSLPSHAVWVDKNIAELKQAYEQQNNPDISQDLINDASLISENYIIIECHIETMFRDSSIAYDVSGLRNTNIYLQSPNGSRVYPLQHLLITPVEEQQVGTLKQFNRTNLLIFAMEDIISGAPTLSEDTGLIRLFIEGFDTTFFFEWIAQEPVTLESLDPEKKPDITEIIRWRPTQTETYQVLKIRFTDLYEQLSALTRVHRN